ncbi:DUF5994 family protein [Streptomyces sp. TLI_146]|uniref:DUF5994 family protein n=1 Tax=Streptomyces sp. TLI_146 TaxID=1938858 RepID=UPI000CB7E019|nr:DUF5994 family protein [Streptomyces sp. TLI_146]PKV90052.1 hypothetical protein BX283_7713 [Streptomyces sp. TLI_146]
MTLAPPPSPSPSLASSSAVRLRLVSQLEQGHVPRRIDGAWWPRSSDLVSELPRLLGALPHAWGQVTSALVDAAAWSPFPGRLLVANQVVSLRRTTTQRSPSTVCLLAPGRGRWDLLVVPPTATDAEAGRLMEILATALKDGKDSVVSGLAASPSATGPGPAHDAMVMAVQDGNAVSADRILAVTGIDPADRTGVSRSSPD